jgi:hypothetical protein
MIFHLAARQIQPCQSFSASTGLMLRYGEPWMHFYLLEEIHGIF